MKATENEHMEMLAMYDQGRDNLKSVIARGKRIIDVVNTKQQHVQGDKNSLTIN